MTLLYTSYASALRIPVEDSIVLYIYIFCSFSIHIDILAKKLYKSFKVSSLL
jgi:hypothetical protein